MKLSVSAYRAHASAHKKILSSSYQTTLNYGSTAAASNSTPSTLFSMEPSDIQLTTVTSTTCSTTMSSSVHQSGSGVGMLSPIDTGLSPGDTRTGSMATSKEEEDSSNAASSDCKSPGQRTKSNQRWMKLRTTVQLSSAIQKKPPLKREDSFLKRFSTRQIPETQETMEETGSESASGDHDKTLKRRRRYNIKRKSVVNPDENFYFYWLMVLTFCILYNLWTLIVRQSFPELQEQIPYFWFCCDCLSDIIFVFDIVVQLRTGYLEQGLMVYNDKKLATHYMRSRKFLLDLAALLPLDLLQLRIGTQPLLRFPRFLKVYRSVKFYYIVESRTVWPNLWRVVNLIHILLILAHWFGCFYFLLSEAEGFQGDWVYPYRPGDYATLTRKYLGSLYWSTLTLTTIGDLPTPETNAEYIFTIVSYLIGVFIFATIVGQVGNVITNRNANRLEFERLLDGAKTYMRHHKVPGGMKRRVLRWYDYSWSRGRIQGGGDINTALGLLPDKLKTELALHVNLSVLKKVTIFQECQPEFLHDLVLKMKAYIFTPGDSICRKGEVAREMFIIADGILEVLSETGKVLTTMKAGDFFGEIGILNLDGLNKRTADVRSVGYSELFSLSREDVLAAMKDYPEAQEILQTLGRKRLMEVRCVNKKHAKHLADKESNASNVLHPLVDNSCENRTSKRIVDKLRSDVKGLRNVLRKSRNGRRSNESIELQALHTSSGTIKTPKGVLRRMPRVRSDEIATEEEIHETKEKTPSPIGAGLPLLQRLRLLKEKQDREERAVKSALPMIPSNLQSHLKSAVSPQQSIQEEPEREIVGAGLPLLQRLKLLKAKEERIARENQSKTQSTQQATTTLISFVHSAQLKPPTTSPLTNLSVGLVPSQTLAIAKPSLKVSFRERIKNMQKDHIGDSNNSSSSSGKLTLLTDKESSKNCSDKSDMKEQLISNAASSSSSSFSSNTKHINKPSSLSIKEKIKQFGQSHHHIYPPKVVNASGGDDQPLKPWSKLKLATVVSTGGSYSSLNNSFNDGSPTENIPLQKILKKKVLLPSNECDNNYIVDTTASTSNERKISNERICISDSELKITKTIASGGPHSSSSTSVNNSSSNNKCLPTKLKLKTQKTIRIIPSTDQQKNYRSVDDLSPEYSGLPFVKKLKILNERQKLAELESVIQTRSFSLDCTDSGTNDLMEPLIRSHSEASGMGRTTKPTTNTAVIGNYQIDSSVTTPINIPSHQCLQSPLSPESNETLERRHLKSILKKLSEEKSQQQQHDPAICSVSSSGTDNSQDLKGLLRAHTLEGPPNSAHSAVEAIEERSEFPALSAQQPFTSSTTTTSTSSATALLSLPSSLSTTTKATAIQQNSDFDNLLVDASENRLQEQDDIKNDVNKMTDDNLSPKRAPFLSKKFLKGSIEEHEYFGEVLLGIKLVIQNHLREVQTKFQDRFQNLELDIRQRDDTINQLQRRINELEQCPSSHSNELNKNGSGTASSASSGDMPFVRGDSVDTIFVSSPQGHYEKNRTKLKSKKRSSPRRKNLDVEQSKDGGSSESIHSSSYRGLAAGRMAGISESVVLNIDGCSSNTSSSSGESHLDEDYANDDEDDDDDDDGDGNDEEELHCDDWEIRMLAAELNRRESNKKEDISSDGCSDPDERGGLLRRRRKKSESFDTDTEISDNECDLLRRPRAASLDHHNIRRQKSKGVFKAMSFDRDKDRL